MPSFNPEALWDAKPHTQAKIEIVRRYLYLWFSILSANPRNQRLVYIDGFAGPGEYTNSAQSSPIAALHAAKEAVERLPRIQGIELYFLFVEKRQDFAENLQLIVTKESWPSNFRIQIKQGAFEEIVGSFLQDLKVRRQALPPTFVFIDPFGATGLPFRVVAELLSYPSCEVLLNLDSDGVGRLITAQEFQKNQQNLNTLFGDNSWKKLDPTLPMQKLSAAVLSLYKNRLRALQNIRYIFPFAMNTRHDQLNYHLVFASQHPLGLEKMKEVMKAVDQTGSYSFSDDSVGQSLLPFDFNAPEEWARKMQRELGGAWRPYSEFNDFALCETPFTNPKAIFELLKTAGKLQVNWIGPSAKHGFPETKIRSIFIQN